LWRLVVTAMIFFALTLVWVTVFQKVFWWWRTIAEWTTTLICASATRKVVTYSVRGVDGCQCQAALIALFTVARWSHGQVTRSKSCFINEPNLRSAARFSASEVQVCSGNESVYTKNVKYTTVYQRLTCIKTVSEQLVFSRPYERSRLCYSVASVCPSSVSVTFCIVSKRCVLEQKLLLTAHRKLYVMNRLVPKWIMLTFLEVV